MHWQVTFVIINRFCVLPNPPLPTQCCSKLTTSGWMKHQAKLNEKYTPAYIVKLNKKYTPVYIVKLNKKYTPTYIVVLFQVYISFYISRCHFLQLFRTSIRSIWKKIFISKFPFLMDSLKPLSLSSPSSPLLMVKILGGKKFYDKSFLSMLPNCA